jgi:hypothetical protein
MGALGGTTAISIRNLRVERGGAPVLRAIVLGTGGGRYLADHRRDVTSAAPTGRSQ